jgi:elongation factor G
MKALMWRGETQIGEDYTVEEIPADLRPGRRVPHELIDVVAESDDALMEKYLEGEELTVEELKAGIRRGSPSPASSPGPLWHRLQEQGRAADARRGRRLPALPARRPPIEGHKPGDERSSSSASPATTTSRSRRWRSRSPPTPTSAS